MQIISFRKCTIERVIDVVFSSVDWFWNTNYNRSETVTTTVYYGWGFVFDLPNFFYLEIDVFGNYDADLFEESLKIFGSFLCFPPYFNTKSCLYLFVFLSS